MNKNVMVSAAILGGCLMTLSGCEGDSWMDPSKVGRFERTPVTLPILDRIDVIEPQEQVSFGRSGVLPEDLIPDVREYVIGINDLITVTVFELIVPGVDSVNTRRVDELGMIRLPGGIGPVKAAGQSPSTLEKAISDILDQKGLLRDASVTVIVQQATQNTYSIIGEPEQDRTAFGTYAIPRPDFRLMDAIALARGVPGRTKTLQIFRQIPLTREVAGEVPAGAREAEDAREGAPAGEPQDPAKLIEGLLQGMDPDVRVEDAAPPPGMDSGMQDAPGAPKYVSIEGKWVRVESVEAQRVEDLVKYDPEALRFLISQRIIEIPYKQLIEGDMRFNIVIRPGDVIKVPARNAGFVYIMGEISRPGAYTVPGENDLTLKQLVASAGGLGALAIPERVDLIRRVNDTQEATIRLNLRAIFDGTQPDFFLKTNDMINVGTNFFAAPLAVIRNGFRMTYGFGFIADRNFATEIFGP
jgi:polysaccharide export outer membrane protein